MTSILILRVYPYSPQGGNYDIWWDVNPKGCGDPGPMPMVVSSSSWGYPRYHPSFWLGSSPINQPFWGYPYLRKAPYHTISIIHLQVTIEFRYTIHLLYIYSSSAVHLLFIHKFIYYQFTMHVLLKYYLSIIYLLFPTKYWLLIYCSTTILPRLTYYSFHLLYLLTTHLLLTFSSFTIQFLFINCSCTLDRLFIDYSSTIHFQFIHDLVSIIDYSCTIH